MAVDNIFTSRSSGGELYLNLGSDFTRRFQDEKSSSSPSPSSCIIMDSLFFATERRGEGKAAILLLLQDERDDMGDTNAFADDNSR
jgi:hypothetical protein